VFCPSCSNYYRVRAGVPQPRQPKDGRLLRQPAPPVRRLVLGAARARVVFCSLTLAWLTLYAFAIDRLRRLFGGPVRRALDAIAGAVLVALGIRLAAEER
jgi:threonine/homoserine/homoserine lactone efflux protein